MSVKPTRSGGVLSGVKTDTLVALELNTGCTGLFAKSVNSPEGKLMKVLLALVQRVVIDFSVFRSF